MMKFFFTFAFADDFEKRFTFNTDLPAPEPYKDFPKTYPSENKTKGRGKRFFVMICDY